MIGRSAVVPHAPALLAGVRPDILQTHSLRRAVGALEFADADCVVIVSSHGTWAGVYERPQGSLDDFGMGPIAVTARGDDELARDLKRAWGRPLLDGPADFGVCVPLLLGLARDRPVVGVALPEATGPGAHPLDEVLGASEELAGALELAGRTKDIAVVASAHSSAGLSPRAPLTEVPGAAELHSEVTRTLAGDPFQARTALMELGRAEGACGVGPLSLLTQLCRGWSCLSLRSESVFGVGYLVGEWAA